MNIVTIPAGRSPYQARLNNKRKGTRSTTIIRDLDARQPNRSVGESEQRITLGRPAIRFRFKFNMGKHFKPAGGSMRAKGARRSRHQNYIRPAVDYTALTRQILDAAPATPIITPEVQEAPPVRQHFGLGLLDRIRSKSPF